MTNVGKQVKCDHCGAQWASNSPPSRDEYNAAHVYVDKLEILLPDKVVALRHKEGVSDSHALFLEEKDFCDIDCLLAYITDYMKGIYPA